MTCKNKNTALAILEAIIESVRSGTQRTALEAVTSWIQNSNFDDTSNMTPEQRSALVLKIKTELRDCMSTEERRAEAAFYLEGLKEVSDGND